MPDEEVVLKTAEQKLAENRAQLKQNLQDALPALEAEYRHTGRLIKEIVIRPTQFSIAYNAVRPTDD